MFHLLPNDYHSQDVDLDLYKNMDVAGTLNDLEP